MKPYVSYIRLSKKQTARAGQPAAYYGLEAQRTIISEEINQQKGTLLKEYVELEGGTSKNLKKRVEIFKALRHAKQTNSTIIVAKLDRLARDTEFLLSIINSGVDVLFCDFRFEGIAGKMLLTIISAFAEYEALRISQRTREGLAVAKARGKVLGNPNLHLVSSTAAMASVKSRKDNYHQTANMMVKSRIEMMSTRDGMSLQEIADTLNAEGLTTTKGKVFNERIIAYILNPPKVKEAV